VHKWLRKRPDALSRSCRGSRDPQLSNKLFGSLLLKKFEKNPPKQCYPETFGARTSGNVGVRDVPPSHVGLTAIRHRACTPRKAGDCWSVRGAEARLCMVLVGPKAAPRVAPACADRRHRFSAIDPPRRPRAAIGRRPRTLSLAIP
jgi:hypothetical protein